MTGRTEDAAPRFWSRPAPGGAPGSGGESVDVLVIGGGGAGLAAAVAAAQRGVSVALVEARPELGGSTALSLGSFSAAGTSQQRRRGIVDSPDAFAEDMARFIAATVDRDNPALRAVLAAEAAVTLRWLERLGVPFAGPFPEPPHRVPRMHNVVPNSQTYLRRLARAARSHGVRIRLGAPVVELLRGDDGTVDGALVGADRSAIHATRGVILATGDFSGNPALRRKWLGELAAAATPVNPDSQGDGFALAGRLGAALVNLDIVRGPQLRFGAAPRVPWTERIPLPPGAGRLAARLVSRAPRPVLRRLAKPQLIAHLSPAAELFQAGAILVDLNGSRFCAEPDGTGALALRPAGTGYIVLDQAMAERFRRPPHFISTAPGIAYAYFDDYRRGRPDLVTTAGSPEQLAGRLGLPAGPLAAALASAPRRLVPPLHALGPVRSMLTTTEGALRVDTSLRVLTKSGTAIAGLYAVGALGQGGMVLEGHGLHLAWAFTSGRLAGAGAARAIPRTSLRSERS